VDALSPNSKVTFLTIPFYSTEAWSKKEPTKFREQDNKLEEQILAVNSEIKKLNKENHQGLWLSGCQGECRPSTALYYIVFYFLFHRVYYSRGYQHMFSFVFDVLYKSLLNSGAS
jgi:hypothetical protein